MRCFKKIKNAVFTDVNVILVLLKKEGWAIDVVVH